MAFELDKIFIGRKRQLNQFRDSLIQWKSRMLTTNNIQMTTSPSPDNKIQSLVVLLYGCGGFGKSTLLKRYHEIAGESDLKLAVSKIVNWEFDIGGKYNLFNPPPGQEIDAFEYFKLLCSRLAVALTKDTDEFKEYQKAVAALKKVRQQANEVLDSLLKDEQFVKLRGLTTEAIVTLIRTAVPVSNVVLSIPGAPEIAKEALDVAEKIGVEQLVHVYTFLSGKMKHNLDDYLDPSFKLGLSLGHDLFKFANNFPLLIFFDTYEEIDEADHLLRLVMGASGMRVGWVLAGRDNLWSGFDQRQRSIKVVYGYEDIVLPDCGLKVDFNDADMRAFNVGDIFRYFGQLPKETSSQIPLPSITEDAAKHIWEVTHGVPLAVRLAAGLYLEKADLNTITDKADSKQEIVQVMVQRYLLHTQADQGERAQLYGLALLRRADRTRAITAALDLSPEQAKTDYEIKLKRMHRRYSFIFNKEDQPLLYPEVRYFLRLDLLARRSQPEIEAVNERLKEAHEAALKVLEDQNKYSSLRSRLEDEEWTGTYLDLTEQKFWLNPTEGTYYCLPFMLAAALYSRDSNSDAARVGNFFEPIIAQPHRQRWKLVAQSLIFSHNLHSSGEVLMSLEQLNKVISQPDLKFPQPFSDYRAELEAALWWRLGEAHQSVNEQKAMEWYKKSLDVINQGNRLRDAREETVNPIASALIDLARRLYREKQYSDCIALLNIIIELIPDFIEACRLRGISYTGLKQYQQAIKDYTHVLILYPEDSHTYYNRGNANRDLKQYQQAIEDYTSVLDQTPNDVNAYTNRGLAYFGLKEYQKGVEDFNQALALDSKNIYTKWIAMWATIQEDRVKAAEEIASKLEEIATFDSDNYIIYVCQGVIFGLHGKLKEGLEKLEEAIQRAPEEWDPYFWKGMICAYRGQHLKAQEAFEQALNESLPPILLTPLRWFKQDNPAFYKEYAGPLLTKYNLL